MITRKDVEGNTWRQDAGGEWHPWQDEEPMVSQADLQEQAPETPSIIQDMPDTGDKLSFMDNVSGTAGSILQGATAEWADETLAMPMTAFAQMAGDAPEGESVMETYGKIKGTLRDRQKRFEEESPVLAPAAKMLGGMAPAGKAMSGAGLLKTGLVGAGYGAAEYAGGLDDWSDAQLLDATLQTGLGGVLPVGMQKSGDGIRHWLANRKDDEVTAVIDKLVKDTGRTPQQIRNKGSDLGPNASLVDATGDVGVAYGQGGRAKGTIKSADIIERNYNKIETAKDRVRDTMEMASGKRQGQFYRTREDLIENRRANAEQNYGAALDEGTVLPTKRMLHIFDTNPMVKEAWADVQNTYAKNSLPLPKLFSDVNGKSINVDGERWPNMRAMQELKWAMDKNLKTLKGSADAAGKKEYQRALSDYKDFMTDVNKQNPLFKKANADYAGDSAMIDAQETGFKHGLGSKDIEQHMEYIDGLNKSEKDAYLQGVMSKIYGEMGTSPENVLGNMNKITSENAKQVLSKLVGKDKAKKIFNKVASEKRYREVNTELRKGSQTELRKIAGEAFDKKAKSIPIEMLQMTPTGRIIHAIRQYDPSMTQAQADDVVNIITKEGGIDKALLRLEMIGKTKPEAEAIVGEIIKSSSAVAPATLMGEEQ